MVKLAGVVVARIGLGTNRLTNTHDNVAFIKSAVAAGVQVIDTAHLYSGGHSEETIGAALSPVPDGVIVATKGGYNSGAAGVLREEIDQSLRSLRTKRITLYYLHRADIDTPLETSLKTIKEYVDKGAIAHVGLSQVSVEQVERARKVVPVAAVQCRYNLADRTNDPVIDYCEREDIVFVPFFPLRDGGGGSALREIATRRKLTPQQVMLAWLLKRSPVMLPIPGTLSLDHLKENVAAQHIELTDKEFAALR